MQRGQTFHESSLAPMISIKYSPVPAAGYNIPAPGLLDPLAAVYNSHTEQICCNKQFEMLTSSKS